MSERRGRRTAALALVLLSLLGPGSAFAQKASEPRSSRAQPEMAVHLYTLQNQRAVDALQWLLPLLSDLGSVELRPGGNTVVVRERRDRMGNVLEALRRFDHEKQEVTLRLWLVRAQPAAPISPPVIVDRELEAVPEVLERLRDYLQFDNYLVLGSSETRAQEGESVTFELSAEYAVRFRLGTVLALRRIPLEGFEVAARDRDGKGQPLMRSHLNLWVDRPLVLALSSNDQEALLIVVQGVLTGPKGGS